MAGAQVQVRFYTGAQDPVAVSLRLLHKCRQQGLRTLVYGSADVLQPLSRSLWAQEGFWAHAAPQETALRRRSPIVLTYEPITDAGYSALLHLGDTDHPQPDRPVWPPGVTHVLEVVGLAPEAQAAARQRFRAYRAEGWTPTHHEVRPS